MTDFCNRASAHAARWLSSLFVLVFLTLPAKSEVLITVEELSGNVVFSYSGSIDLTGLSVAGSTNGAAFVTPRFTSSASALGIGNNVSMYGYAGSVMPAFGTAGFMNGIATGPGFSIFANGYIALAQNYVSGSLISGTLTILNQTVASLGLIDGIYKSTLANGDYAQLTIGSAAVPLPAALPLLGGAMAAFGLVGWRRRRQSNLRA